MHPISPGFGNNVYVVFHSSRGVFLIKVTDGGSSFGNPLKLNPTGYGIKIYSVDRVSWTISGSILHEKH